MFFAFFLSCLAITSNESMVHVAEDAVMALGLAGASAVGTMLAPSAEPSVRIIKHGWLEAMDHRNR